jgi:hypothetical protein
VGRAHPVPGLGQLGREVEPLSGTGGAARARAGRSELDRRAIEVNLAKGMLDDVSDGAEPDIFPLRRHPPYGGLAKRRTGQRIPDQVRYLALPGQVWVPT